MSQGRKERAWRVVCTLGPASDSAATIEALVHRGMAVARLNFSHGTRESHRRIASTVREVSGSLERPVAVLQDLQGHKVRAGELEGDAPLQLRLEQEILVGPGDHVSAERIGVDYPELSRFVEPGHEVYLDDGQIQLRVISRRGDDLLCEVHVGGELHSRKGAIFPASRLDFPLINRRDLEDARFGVSIGVDMVAMSFVRSAAELNEMRERLEDWGAREPFVVAKIEDPTGIENLDGILEAADAVLIARGDLGVTLPREKVPAVQKEIIRKANASGVAVITATQMLESMTRVDQPTRAEVNDVYNAVLDGTDAVMLSGETASGRFPVLAVEEMDRICREAAGYRRRRPREDTAIPGHDDLQDQLAEAAARMTRGSSFRCILALSRSGAMLRALSAARPPVPVFGVVPDASVQRRLQLHWGLSVTVLPRDDDLPRLTARAIADLRRLGAVRAGERVIVIAGALETGGGSSPVLMIEEVRE